MTDQDRVDLPAEAWHEIAARCGKVCQVEHASTGINADFAASVHTSAAGRVFVKGARLDGKNVAAHRTEALVNDYLPVTLAPRMVFQIEVAGWLVLVFEHVSGRHPDIAPGSPDLPVIAATVSVIQQALTPCPPVDVASLADQWGRLSAWRSLSEDTPTQLDRWTRDLLRYGRGAEAAAIACLRGDSLVHGDAQPLNILVDGDRARVIDWAWSRRAAPWVDVAFLVIRLIRAGHSPADAEEWAARTPAWRALSDTARTLFAVEVLGVWEWLQHHRPLPHRAPLTDAARTWARCRLEGVTVAERAEVDS